MAKKLNKKVFIVVIVLVLVVGGVMASLLAPKVFRRLGWFQDPDKYMAKANQYREAGDYENAEKEFKRAIRFGKTDEYKKEKFFEFAEFHLIHNELHEANWMQAMACWNEIISKYDKQNIEAHRKMLDYYYQAADAGDVRSWEAVRKYSTELIDILREQESEPDTFYTMAKARALLSIAQRREMTDSNAVIHESIALLNQLIEDEPQNEEYYRLIALAATVKWELSGVIDARERAEKEATGFLEAGLEKAEDKATALANFMMFKMQTTLNDPNALDAIRVEIDERSKGVQPNAKLWLVTSVAYERPGSMSAESEVNRAIEAVRRAHELEPEDFEYTFQLARLMYRKGNAFNDPAATEDAVQIAEEALLLKETQDIPGPFQMRNRGYRFTLNNFLADIYLEKALAAKESGADTELQNYVQKAEERVEEIIDTMGSADNPRLQKFKGLIALAKGQQGEAVRLLYKAYEAGRAMDKPGERSSVDSRVCMALAHIAQQQDQIGLQLEFLRGAFTSRDNYLQQNPKLLLEYAQVARQFRDWNSVIQAVGLYQSRYGVNEQSRKLKIEASIGLGEFDRVKELLNSYEGAPAEKLHYELYTVHRKVNQLKQTIALLKENAKEPTPEQAQELTALRVEQNSLLEKLLKTDQKQLNSSILSEISVDLIQTAQTQRAIQYLDTYLTVNPNVLDLQFIRLQAQQEDPLNLTSEKRMQLREQAINLLGDAKTKAILLADLYRSQGEYEKVSQVLEQNPQIDADDPDIIQARFDIALMQKDFQKAENLQQIIRTKNLDKCEGLMAAARLEIAKENYPLALQRLNECLLLRPLYSYIYFLKSQTQRQLENEAGAIESAKKFVSMDPQNALYAKQLAYLLFSRNTALASKLTREQESEAERAVRMAVQLNPGDSQLRRMFSEIIKGRDPDQALLTLRRLLGNDPTAVHALMLGQMAMRMADAENDAAKKTGLIELAGKAYQRGIEVEPDNKDLLQAYADYKLKTEEQIDPREWFKGDKNLEWQFYLRNGQYEQAEVVLKDLIQKTPDDPLLVRGFVLVYQGIGKRDLAKQYLETLSGLDKTKETELWIFQRYMDNGFVAETEEKLGRFKDQYPDEKAATLIGAWVEMGKGRLNEAMPLANRYLETNIDNASAWQLRGRLHRLMGQPKKAIEDLKRSQNLLDTPEVRMELATVYSESGQVDDAIFELESGLDDPQAPARMRMMLEDLYLRDNQMSDLVKLYDSTLKKYPQSSLWHFHAGRFYLGQKDLVKAQKLLQKSWELSLAAEQPSDIALNYYLESLFQDQQYDKAMRVASGTIDTPLAMTGYGFMAQIHFKLGQKEKALESFNKALDKCKSTDSALEGVMRLMLVNLGEDAVTAWISRELAENEKSLKARMLASTLATGKGAYNEAIERLGQCIQIVGPNSPQWPELAEKKAQLQIMAYLKTADQNYLTDAAELLTEILRVQPNNASLMNNLAYLLVDNNQQAETALEYARKAHQAVPGNPVFLDTYAYAQCRMGQFEQAEQNLIRAVQVFELQRQPIPWDLYEHFGMAREGLGKTDQAIEMYRKALDASAEISDKKKQQLQAAIERLQKN